MFVPRALRLKGVLESPRTTTAKPRLADKSKLSNEDALVDAMEGISTNSSTSHHEKIDSKAVTRGPRFTTKPITTEYLAQLVVGMELIFSDYAHQEEMRAAWLQQRYRTIDGEHKFIHLTAVLDHLNISTLKPEATQVLLQQALREHPSEFLELASNGYHVRRKPSSYPPKFLIPNSFDSVNDDGLSFWDQRTIYVEPHLRNICQTPAKLAHWLKEHGQLRSKWLPIQAVHMLWNSCAFVVLSSSVMHENTWLKWRATEKPDNWKIMTKVEHTKRTAEYIALLEKQNPKGMRKAAANNSTLPAIARPAVLAMNVDLTPNHTETVNPPKHKRKRNRRKRDKDDYQNECIEANDSDAAAEGAQDSKPKSKRRA
ncbi:hypothetical protein GQ44DRAFT_690692 [Phaeosphaeriaceae sp. PMI808]|nr:hypothetical protein GQ44DRAFT_690692 [Phaeosphaeriaceae sp. PMI808]